MCACVWYIVARINVLLNNKFVLYCIEYPYKKLIEYNILEYNILFLEIDGSKEIGR